MWALAAPLVLKAQRWKLADVDGQAPVVLGGLDGVDVGLAHAEVNAHRPPFCSPHATPWGPPTLLSPLLLLHALPPPLPLPAGAGRSILTPAISAATAARRGTATSPPPPPPPPPTSTLRTPPPRTPTPLAPSVKPKGVRCARPQSARGKLVSDAIHVRSRVGGTGWCV